MDINEWEEWYEEILDTLGFSREGDEKTADLLDSIRLWCRSFLKETH